jgi:hypothetical protein
MTTSFSLAAINASATRARFAAHGLEAITYSGAGLPRGYFCSVTPP